MGIPDRSVEKMSDDEQDDLFPLLEKHRVEIMDSIDTEKQFLQCYLRSKLVFDDEDCERISNGETRRERAVKLLNILALKGQEACKHFIDALEFESPTLYEKITGKTADARITPVPHENGNNGWNWTIGIDGKALIDFDRQYLAKQLDRAVADLKNMTYLHSKMVEEKAVLEKKLFEAADDLKAKDSCVADLKKEIIQLVSERKCDEMESSCSNLQIPMHDHLQQVWRDNIEKSRMMVALQGKLLATNEQIENLKKTNAELVAKNNTFKSQIRELTIINDNERKNSHKISESVTEQKDELSKELRKWKFKYSTVVEEKECLQNELDSFQKWTEVLNVRFDALSKEKKELLGKSEDCSSRLFNLQDYVAELEGKERWQNFKIETATKKVTRLAEALETVRVDRDKLMKSLEDAKVARNKSEDERAQLSSFLKTQEVKHESEMDTQRKLFGELNDKHRRLLEDLRLMETRALSAEKELIEAELALEKMKKNVPGVMSDVHQSKLSSSSTKEAKTEEGKTTIFTEENGYFGRKNRRRQSLIESIRNKLRGSTLPSNFQPVSKELLDFEELLLMNPSSFGQKAVTLPSFISQKDLEKFNSNYGAKTDKCTKKHNRDVRVNEISGDVTTLITSSTNQNAKHDGKTGWRDSGIVEPFRERCFCIQSGGNRMKKRSESLPDDCLL